MNRYAIALIIGSLFCCLPMSAIWKRSVTNYSHRVYRASSQNWMSTQSKNGWMYFANNKGLLEFDGCNWNLYSTRNAKTRSVKEGNDGCIYVGGLHQFGYFKPNDLGGMDYTCLSDSVESNEIGNIWNIHTIGKEVYFISDKKIFCFKDGKIDRIPLSGITYSTLINDELFVVTVRGIFVLRNHKTSLLPNTERRFNNTDKKIVGIYAYKRQLLVITSCGDIQLYGEGKWSSFHSNADRYLKGNFLYCSIMKDSLLALGTVLDGVLLLDMDKDIVEHLSMNRGLQNKTVLSLSFDRNDNLWLGLENGIDCVHLRYPVLQLNETIGSGYASCMYQGNLYVGTNQRLYRVDDWKNDDCSIHPIESTAGQVYSLAVCDDKLFCSGSNALTVIDGSRSYQIEGIRGAWCVAALRQKDLLLVGSYVGLYLLKKTDGCWKYYKKVEGRLFSSKSQYVDLQKNMALTANKEDGIYSISFSEKSDSLTRIKCLNSKLLPKGDNVCITTINHEVVIASRYGLFRYNSLADSLERYDWLEHALDGRVAYTYVKQDAFQNIWYVADGSLKLLRYDSAGKKFYRNKNESYLKNCLIEDFEHVNVLEAGKALIGMEDGFSLLDFNKWHDAGAMYDLQIRRVYYTGERDSLIYGCSYLPNNKSVVIPYKNNSIRIEYNTNDTGGAYYCRLEGPVSETWCYQGNSDSKEYTALPEGHYTFYVRTNIDSSQPLEASFSFDVLPPWYRTWWSYFIYLSLIALIIYYTYHRLVAGKKRLLMQKELELYHQKEAFQKENMLKNQKMSALEKEKLQAELKYKSEELLRSTMNVVRKNETLLEIKKEVMGFSASIKEEDMVALRRKTLRLLSQINTNLDHDDDMLNFQNMFDAVHNGFFRILEEKYPDLSRKEKLLCAYIHMNLLSKEIAPLLNISLRGVEISRYRLRKKLKLQEGENLVEFLQKLSK